VAEFVPVLEEGAGWIVDTNAVITALGGNEYRVVVGEAPLPMAYYRVIGLGGSGPIVIGFGEIELQGSEGGTVQAVIAFDRPFWGTIRYTVSGTAGVGDYAPLTGAVQVTGGTSVLLPIQFRDDTEISALRDLVVKLEAGEGYRVEAGSSTAIVTLEDNDAVWRGSLFLDDAVLGFKLRIEREGGGITGVLQGEGFGMFAGVTRPATVTFSDQFFSAVCSDIPLEAEVNLMGVPAIQELRLTASDSEADERVDLREVRGVARLETRYPLEPHLDFTSTGTFLLLRPPGRSSTNEVELLTNL
jgi:hypothetical protein